MGIEGKVQILKEGKEDLEEEKESWMEGKVNLERERKPLQWKRWREKEEEWEKQVKEKLKTKEWGREEKERNEKGAVERVNGVTEGRMEGREGGNGNEGKNKGETERKMMI